MRPNYGDMDRIAMSQSRILLPLLLVGLIACWPTSTPRAQTAPDVFQVSGIPVDATAADAVAARDLRQPPRTELANFTIVERESAPRN